MRSASRMRYALLALMLILMGAGIYVMYRRSVTRARMEEAYALIPDRPEQAFDRLLPVLRQNPLLSGGMRQRAMREFADRLVHDVIEMLRQDPPDSLAFDRAFDSIEVFQVMRNRANLELDDTGHTLPLDQSQIEVFERSIIEAARLSLPSVREHGSLETWRKGKRFFVRLAELGRLPKGGVYDYFEEWFSEIEAVPERPLNLRDTIHRIQHSMVSAMLEIGAVENADEAERTLIAAIPPNVESSRMTSAELNIQEALMNQTLFSQAYLRRRYSLRSECRAFVHEVVELIRARANMHWFDRWIHTDQFDAELQAIAVQYLRRTFDDLDHVLAAAIRRRIASHWPLSLPSLYSPMSGVLPASFGLAFFFDTPTFAPELIEYAAILEQNKGALRTSHLIDRGAVLDRMGSLYVATVAVGRFDKEYPPVSEMVQEFRADTERRFGDAAAFLNHGVALTPDQRDALELVIDHNRGLLRGQQQPGEVESTALPTQLLDSDDPLVIAVIEALRQYPGRPLLITRFSGDPQG